MTEALTHTELINSDDGFSLNCLYAVVRNEGDVNAVLDRTLTLKPNQEIIFPFMAGFVHRTKYKVRFSASGNQRLTITQIQAK